MATPKGSVMAWCTACGDRVYRTPTPSDPYYCDTCDRELDDGQVSTEIPPDVRLALLREALAELRDAREQARLAGAPCARRAVARAMKSVEGAIRHAEARQTREVARG